MRKEFSSLSFSAVFFLLAFVPFSSHAGKNGERTSLEHVLQQVYEGNPSLMAARAELKATQEQMPQARAGYLPTVSAEASVYSSNVESSNFGSGDGATTKEFSLNAEQPLWRGGKTTADIARAREVINAGESVLIKSEQDMFLRTIIVYMNVMRDRELVGLRGQNEAIMTQELQAAQDRKAIGDVTDTSVQQAKARLARAESERIDAESSLDISIAEFEEIVGMTPQNSLEFPNTSFSFPQGLGEMKTAAEKQNPEIKIAEYETQAAEHNTDSVFSELLPRISAFASFNKQYDPQPGIVDETRTDTIGVRATMTLYEGGATRSRVREARQQVVKSRHRVDEAKRRVQQQVISNWRSYIAAQAEKKTRMVEIDATEEALKGLREESRMGQRTILDILDADQDVIDAKVALAHARRNEIVAKYSLASALGILTSDAFGITFDDAATQ